MGRQLSAKNKIMIFSAVWIFVSTLMFLFLFKIMDARNQAALNDMAKNRQDLVTLQGQSLSFKQAQADLDKMAKMDIQPKDFFSKDITLVKEIQVLENLDGKFNTKITFSGVSGVVTEGLQPSDTISPLVYVPYTLQINGSFSDVLKLIQTFENLSFVTKVNQISLTSSGDGKTNAALSSGFYVERN